MLRNIIFVLTVICGVSIIPLRAHATPLSYSADIVVQSIQGPTVAEKISQRTGQSWPWYIARGSGMVAAITLVILLLSGIGLVTGYTFRFWEPLTAWASHRALGIIFSVSVVVHMLSLLFDHFVHFSILTLFVP